jgi:MoxR-like ATPase
MAGMFMRACQATSSKDQSEKNERNIKELLHDVSKLRKALESDLRSTMSTSEGGQQNVLWLGADEAAAAATAMRPKMQSARKAVEALLFEVVALEVRTLHPASPNTCLFSAPWRS